MRIRILNPNGISIGSAVLHSSSKSVTIRYNGPPDPFPLKIAHSHKGIWTHI